MLYESEHSAGLKYYILVTITDTVTSKTFHSDCCTDSPLITVPYHPKKARKKNRCLTLKEGTNILTYNASMATVGLMNTDYHQQAPLLTGLQHEISRTVLAD